VVGVSILGYKKNMLMFIDAQQKKSRFYCRFGGQK
jgi:hypothetical protein